MRALKHMSMAEYLALPEKGSSDIVTMSDYGFDYWKKKKAKPRDEDGRASVVGSVTHLTLQGEVTKQPGLVERAVRVYHDPKGLKHPEQSVGFAKFQQENPRDYCVSEGEMDLAKRMVHAVMSEPEALQYLVGALSEPTIVGNYLDSAIIGKCRPDYLHVDRGISVNFKTTKAATERQFILSMAEYGYDWQSVWHTDVLATHFKKKFDEVHILVEKGETPEDCAILVRFIDEETLEFARGQIWEVVQKLAECEKTGVFPRKPVRSETTGLPLHMRRICTL